MSPVAAPAARRFEAYVVMSMRRWLTQLGRVDAVDSALAAHGLDLDGAEKIHQQCAAALRDEASQFEAIQQLLDVDGRQSQEVGFVSQFWPGFCFSANRADDGSIAQAGYRDNRGQRLGTDFPRSVPLWSCDVPGFADRFGPLTFAGRRPLSAEVLPCYESHDFDWGGERYGATFQWGLFLIAAVNWD